MNGKCNRFKEANSQFSEQVLWTTDNINPDFTIDRKVKDVMTLCAGLNRNNLISRPIYDLENGTVDAGAVFKDLTHQISGGLEKCCFLMPIDDEHPSVLVAVESKSYFEGSHLAIIPAADRDIQNDKTFFFGLGKYLLLTLLHGGSFPVL